MALQKKGVRRRFASIFVNCAPNHSCMFRLFLLILLLGVSGCRTARGPVALPLSEGITSGMIAPERLVASFPDVNQIMLGVERSTPIPLPSPIAAPPRLREDPPAQFYYGDSWNNRDFRTGPRWNPTDTVVLHLLSDQERYHLPVGKPISEFGPRGRSKHTGLDLKMDLGDSLFASFDGKVRFAGTYSGYGKAVLIRCYNGLELVYAHLSDISVAVNQAVTAGDLIGRAGRTGRATTVHLHLETRYKGEPFNPRLVFNHAQGMLRTATLILTPSSFKQNGNRLPDNELSFALQSELISRRVTGPSPSILTSGPEMRMASQPHIQPQLVATELVTPQQTQAMTVAMGNSVIHTVQKGDTLYALARRYGTSIHAICSRNGITDKSVLRLGQKLQIL